jgi:hypothetical protein
METQLTLTQEQFSTTMALGEVLSKSGFFSDTKQAAQAFVKVIAGREIGFGPIASMTGIHIVQGKPTVGANLMAAAVKSHPRYDYRIKELTEHNCILMFYQDGQTIGESQFSLDDAKKAGLTSKDIWQKFPRNMLFSRAISNGARWFCPDVFSGVTPYTPEELGADVAHDDNGDIIDVTPQFVPEPQAEPAEEPQPTPGNGNMAKLLVVVNRATSGYYNHPAHLLHALKQDLGADLVLPEADDRDGWNKLYAAAVAHTKKEAA